MKFLTEARGNQLVASGRVLRSGSTLTVTTVEISAVFNHIETLCATALVTIRTINPA